MDILSQQIVVMIASEPMVEDQLLEICREARIAALSSGGAIPDTTDYRVLTADERAYVGSANEDFALESLAGDVFLLGTSSWRIQHVRGG